MAFALNLRTQIYLILILTFATITTGGVAVVRYTRQIEFIMSEIITKNLASYQIAESLENALVKQKGFVTYYYLDRDPDWLKQLGEFRQVFKESLRKMEVLVVASDIGQRQTFSHLKGNYHLYVKLQDRVVDYYAMNKVAAGLKLHQNVRSYFSNIMEACENLKEIQKRTINLAWKQSQAKAQRLIGCVIVTIMIVALLVILLTTVLVMKILGPLRKLSLEAAKENKERKPANDLAILKKNVRGLIREADLAQAALQQNREALIQSEKLALVGKLAAGMAHSIRNPLTSVKMRLFSLSRSLGLNESQKDDFDVIAAEIKHLDLIVQNFLEFSRPPKLSMQPISLSAVLDQSLQLLQHRLKSYNVTVELDRDGMLDDVVGDAEQLKEVFVNLIVNACESMTNGGTIAIAEDQCVLDAVPYARVLLTDTGSGIPSAIMEKIFQPFFTTKDEGTGLGLSIASRIVEDHHGFLRAKSEAGQGTVFSLMLPVKGEIR